MSVTSGEQLTGSARASHRPLVLTSLVVGAALVLIVIAVVAGSGLRLAAVPLALFIAVGLFFIEPSRLTTLPPVSLNQVSTAALLLIFIFGGFDDEFIED